MNAWSSGFRGRGSTMAPESRGRGLGSRAPRFVRASPALHRTWKAGVFLVGLAVVAGGVLLLPLPGPGWVVIFLGVAVWATEFVWAQLVLRRAKRMATRATRRALDPRVRRRNSILAGVALAVVAALVGVYVAQFGWQLPWRIRR